ncbi:MAG TPA: hypothetical protein VIK18_25375 [Pirellulales bacterium]
MRASTAGIAALVLTMSCCSAATSLAATPARAEIADPARLVPESAAALLAVSDPGPVLDALLSPDYYQPLLALKPIDKTLQTPDFGRLKQLVGLLEMRLGTSWQTALEQLTGGGLTLAFDPQRRAVVLIVKAKDAQLLGKLHATLVDLVEAHARNQGKKSPVESQEHQGVRAWTFGPGEQHAIIGDTLIVSNKREALRAVLDLHADSSARGLAGKPRFQQARRDAAGALAWAMVDLEALRQAPKIAKGLTKKSDNPLVEILAGGILDALRTAPYVTAALRLEDNKLRLQAQLPRDASKIASNRRWCFAPSAAESAPALLEPNGALANLSIYRDLAGMWQAREELFDERVNAGLTKADTGLGLFFSGRDFGPEVLAKLSPRWQFIVARREFSPSKPIPALKLPAMAVILETRDDAFASELFLTFQNIVGIINLQGIQTGRPQLLLDAEEYHGAKIRKAVYLASREAPKDKARVEYNFNPAAARIGSRFIIGSTYELVRELVDLAAAPATQQTTAQQGTAQHSMGQRNTVFEIDGGQVRAALADNRDMLVSRAMLSSGDNRQAAEKQIGSLLSLGRLVQAISLELLAQPTSLTLEATVTLGDPPADSSPAAGEEGSAEK